MTPDDVASERRAQAVLKNSGIDADDMLRRRTQVAAARIAHANATNPELNNQLIRLAGYLLPLEFDRSMHVVEGLLVPFVGACIHVPPPPANQIVHVRPSNAVSIQAFQAVWITGRLQVGAATKELELVDGSADIDVGYAMAAAKVEKYKR